MRFVDTIEKKADGNALTKEEIQEMIDGYVKGDIPDYQMSSMCMAILQKGMTPQETADLTMAMMHSGDVVDLSDLPGVKLDKHSTGGVGDTTTLVVAPLVAACGGTVAKMSGRGLGHTGGTLDKLESIPGTSIEQSMDRFKEIVKENGVAVIGQTGNLVPADKKLYALRDVTATVRSIPLIASSIMSKKLASGADAIVLDVKTGTGAFMRTKEEAFTLAKLMVSIGTLVGRKVRALVTDMNQPLGMAVGNALEVREAVELLSGKIAETDPLYEVCMLLGENMMMLAGLAENEAEAQKKLKQAIADGSGLKRLQKMIALQGGDSSYLTVENMEKLVAVKQHIEVKADSDGYVSSMDAEKIGTAAQLLGAGRAKKEDTIDPAVGLVMRVRCGYAVKKGSSLCTLYVNDDTYLKDVEELLHEAIEITPEKGEIKPMIYGTVTEKDI
jgi:pyrimidine-nucleoside phosphorylase